MMISSFETRLEIIDLNPFVFVPTPVLNELLRTAKKDKGYIPVHGKVNGKPYTQTLLKFRGHWRLYINTTILPNSPKRIGEAIQVSIHFDPSDRSIQPHPKLVKALNDNGKAKQIFDNLPPSKQKEIVRYISFLKSEESIERNVVRAIGFLLGKNRFVGRDKP